MLDGALEVCARPLSFLPHSSYLEKANKGMRRVCIFSPPFPQHCLQGLSSELLCLALSLRALFPRFL